ncbi:hypothetical protein RQP46_001391 [Phenoliferia psychrophenolica]
MTYPHAEEEIVKLGRKKRLEIVIPGPIPHATIHIKAYLGRPTRFQLRPHDPEVGFSREEIIWAVVQMYRYVYAVEEETMPEEHGHENSGMLLNRGRTGGKIWGHDLGDLVLHTACWYPATSEIHVGLDS